MPDYRPASTSAVPHALRFYFWQRVASGSSSRGTAGFFFPPWASNVHSFADVKRDFIAQETCDGEEVSLRKATRSQEANVKKKKRRFAPFEMTPGGGVLVWRGRGRSVPFARAPAFPPARC